MKKILLMVTILVTGLASAFAQESSDKVVAKSNFLDNTFIGIDGGVKGYLFNRDNDFLSKDNIKAIGQVRLGKYITPVAGLQVSMQLGADEDYTKTFISQHNLSLDGLLNLSNLFGGYNGQPRKVEVVYFLGAGWYHVYGVDDTYQSINSISVNTGLQLNWNVTNAWQINFTPKLTYLPELMDSRKFMDKNVASVTFGLTYKFKTSNGTHNFKLVDVRDQNEIDLMNERINSLRKENDILTETNKVNQKVISDLNENVKVLTECCAKVGKEEVVVDITIPQVIFFEIGSSVISDMQLPNLQIIAEMLNKNKELYVTLAGYADAKTGSSQRNQFLSEKRAENVKKILVGNFGVNKEQIKTIGFGSNEQPFKTNEWNRIVLVVTE